MKKILLSILALSVILVSSCSLLDENPETRLSETTVYNSESSLESLIRGCYRGFYGNNLFQGDMNELLHDCSGIIHWKNASTRLTSENYTGALNFTQYSTSTPANSQYSQLYSAVNRCNVILDHLPDSPVDPAFKAEIEGEAKLLRGILYYYLVRIYGDVPLILTCPRSITEMYVKRTSYYKVYGQILSDLTDAENMMRDKARVDELTGGTQSRPNKFAATAFKASVYLQIGSILDSPEDQFFDLDREGRAPDFTACGISTASDAWNLALFNARKVIEEGPYRLAEKFGDLFRWTTIEDFTLPERIFVLTASPQQTTGIYTAIRSLPEYPEGSSNYATSNNNTGRWRMDRWFFQKWCETYPKAMGTGSNNQNIWVSSTDPRLKLTVFCNSYIHNKDKSTVSVYPASGCIYGTSSNGQPYFKKYLDPLYDANSGYADFYMMRLAEMYFIAAEASAALSETPGDGHWQDAFDYIEVIHARARHSVAEGEPDSDQPKWETDRFQSESDPKKALIAGIIWEKMYEMVAEGHEFYDTHRRGATWLRDEVAIPKNEFLMRDEQHATLKPDGETVVSNPWQKGLYGSLDFQYPTEIQDLRKSIVVSFPHDELIRNIALDERADVNDFYWK